MNKRQNFSSGRIGLLQLVLLMLFTDMAAHAKDAQLDSSHRACLRSEVSPELLSDLRIMEIDCQVLQHAHEKRGIVAVPLDYSTPDGGQIEIFYRLLPSSGSKAGDSERPILLIMNGGPGTPSSAYRALDYDYEDHKPADAFSELAKYFRILMVDQRGTGHSAPLDLDYPKTSAETIARLFDSDEHAKDHAKVVERVVPVGEPFFVLARSYGGEIGFKYLLLGAAARQPAGFVFSSAILPHTDAIETFLMRRRKQQELNFELRNAYPGVVDGLTNLRRKLELFGMDPGIVNFLWADLGKGDNWKQELFDKVSEANELDDPATLLTELGGNIRETVNLLNYVLSSAALTPGYTDRTITAETSRRIPFETWMLDENWTLNQIGNDGTWREDFVASVDRSPPPPTLFPPVEEIRQLIGNTQVLFIFGQSDAFLPQDLQLNRAERFSVPGHTAYRVYSDGHGAGFSRKGAAEIAHWAAEIQASRTGNNE